MRAAHTAAQHVRRTTHKGVAHTSALQGRDAVHRSPGPLRKIPSPADRTEAANSSARQHVSSVAFQVALLSSLLLLAWRVLHSPSLPRRRRMSHTNANPPILSCTCTAQCKLL